MPTNVAVATAAMQGSIKRIFFFIFCFEFKLKNKNNNLISYSYGFSEPPHFFSLCGQTATLLILFVLIGVLCFCMFCPKLRNHKSDNFNLKNMGFWFFSSTLRNSMYARPSMILKNELWAKLRFFILKWYIFV